jgi:hypothetical protein
LSLLQNALDIGLLAGNIATVLALVFLGLQMRDERKSRDQEGAVRLFELLDTDKAKMGRKAVYLAFEEKRELTKEETEQAERTIAALNQAAMMVREKLFPKKIAFRMFSSMTIHSWIALESYIKKQREMRHSPSWVEDFEWFFKESSEWKKNHYPKEGNVGDVFYRSGEGKDVHYQRTV